MSHPLSDRFRRWFEHEKHAHASVVASLRGIPPDRLDTPEARRAIETLAHIAAARLAWLARLGIGTRPASIFPKGDSIDQVEATLHTAQGMWDSYFASLDDDDLARTLEYTSIDAGGFRNTLEDILNQLNTHSAYHRGQIAMLVRAAGGEPAKSDFIYWARQPLPTS